MLHNLLAVDLSYSLYNNTSTLSELHRAALAGDLRKVRAEIRAGREIDQYEPALGATPVFGAAFKGHLQIVKELMQAGANINIKASDQMTPLLCGVLSQRVDIVKYLLDKGADIHARMVGYDSGLHIAAKQDSVDIAELLINRGLDVNIRNRQDETALHIVSACGEMKMLRLLLRKGADINATCSSYNNVSKDKENQSEGSNLTPLFLAAFSDNVCVADTLIQAGADVNAKTSESYTALHTAAERGYLKLVNMLLRAGADINVQTSSNRTPLFLATVNGHTNIVTRLLAANGVDIFIPDGKPMDNLLLIAAGEGHLAIVKLLIAHGHPIDGPMFSLLTPLHQAISYEHEDIAEFLIKKGANIHILDSISSTSPLGYTCQLSRFLSRTARLLVEKGVDINTKSCDGATPLHLMVQSKNATAEDVKFLVKHGANPDARHYNGFTPLHYAVLAGNANIVGYLVTKVKEINAMSLAMGTPLHVGVYEGHREIIGILLKNGANTNIVEAAMGSPLCMAVTNGQYEIVEMLLKHEAAVNLKDFKTGQVPLLLATEKQYNKLVILLLNYGADVNVVNKYGKSPIHIACNSGNFDVAKALLAKGAYFDVSVSEKNSHSTPIKIAQSVGNKKIVTLLELIEKLFNAVINSDTQLIKCCIQAGAIVNARNANGSSALHYAVSNENIDAINTLLANGVEIGFMSKSGSSPLHIAGLKKNVEIVKLLLTHAKKLSFIKYNCLVNAKMTESGATVLHTAAENNSYDIVKLLIQNGAIYNEKNKLGKMPLQLTTNEEVKKLLESVEKVYEAVENDSLEEVIQILKNEKLVVNARDSNGGGTPLYWAVSKGRTDIANHLQMNDADYCLVTNKGTTPLHIAASKGNVEVVKMLVTRVKSNLAEKGNDFIDAQTVSGTAALHVASNIDVVKCLLEAGATYNILNGEGKTPLELTKNDLVRKLLKTTHELFKNVKKGVSAVMNTLNGLEKDKFKAVTSARNEQGQTLTVVAATSGQIKVASKVLQKLKLSS